MEKKITKTSALVGLTLVSLLVVACGGIAPEEEALLDQESFSPETSNEFLKAEQQFEAWAKLQAARPQVDVKPMGQPTPEGLADGQPTLEPRDVKPMGQPTPEGLADGQPTLEARDDLKPTISDRNDPGWDRYNDGKPATGVGDAPTAEPRDDVEPMGQPAPEGLADGQPTLEVRDDVELVGQPDPEGLADGQPGAEVQDGLGPSEADQLANQAWGQHNYRPAAAAFNNRLYPR